MKTGCITSMNRSYYDHCGKAMCKSFRKHWLSETRRLHVYNEDLFQIKVRGIIQAGWSLGKDYDDFQQRHTNSKVKTFAKKAFSIIHALEHMQNDYDRIVWLDADLIIKSAMPEYFIDMLCPDDTLSAHFGVVHRKDNREYFSCETGFFVLNCNHPDFRKFLDTYKSIYINDDYSNLRRFYDGEVYGETVRRLSNCKFRELNPNYKYKTPIGHSVLEPYISHLKAGLKDNYSENDLLEKYNLDDEI